MANESATSSLDAKLISNLGQAYEIREFLKEDAFILPQFNIAAAAKASNNEYNKVFLCFNQCLQITYLLFLQRVSLYSNMITHGSHKKHSLSVVYSIPTLRDKILQFIGHQASRAFRVVLGFRDGVKLEHKSFSDRLDQMM